MKKYLNSTTMYLDTITKADVLGFSTDDVFENYLQWCNENNCYNFKKSGLSKEIRKKYGFTVKRRRINSRLVGFYCEV